MSAIPRAHPRRARAWSVRPSPRHRGTRVKRKSKANGSRLYRASRSPSGPASLFARFVRSRRDDELGAIRGFLCLASAARTAALWSYRVPSRPRRGPEEKARRGARTTRARSLSAHGRAVSEPPEHPRFSRRTGVRRPRGREGAFLLVTSLWANKKKATRPPWMADEKTHGREPVFAKPDPTPRVSRTHTIPTQPSP